MIVNKMPNKILVIDDELGPRESLRFLLKPNYEVTCVDSVAKGLEAMQGLAPDAVVMDIRMPGMSGIEGLREIRKIDPSVAVIMLTGFGALETAQEAIRLGANDYIKKPFDADEMREVIRRNVGRTELSRKRARTEREIQELNHRLVTELAQKDRMASLGQASAELVHDLRNPLTVILGYVQILADDLRRSTESASEAPSPVEYVDVIEQSVMRCKDLIDAWLSLARSDASKHGPVSLPELTGLIVQGARSLGDGRPVPVDLVVEPPECYVLGDRIQLMRAVQNIVSNAIEAVDRQRGRVTVKCARSQNRAEISVIDNGPGMTPEQLARACDPYYTTKAANKGTGLGLFITKKIVEDHKGRVTIESSPGQGTTVTIAFPVWEEDASAN
jgi:signal transduction histidine kinase